MQHAKTSLIITAAFIGPGTVTTATLAGAELGYGLLWALLFSILATIIIQDMASRLGLATGRGMSENLITIYKHPALKYSVFVLVVVALGIGNAAYEGGNLSGAALGMRSVFAGSQGVWVSVLGALALCLIWLNRPNLLTNVLVILVAIMSLVFLLAAITAGVDIEQLKRGIMGIGLFDNSTLLLAIIGTTIVPYNIFLHSSLSAQVRQSDQAISLDRKQLISSISLGGLITLAIMSCAANAFFLTQTSVDRGNIASQLSPILGDWAQWFFGIGIFAAGLTSAITAPLATAYAVCGLFFQPGTSIASSYVFRMIATIVVVIGISIALSGTQPIVIIVTAQAANALLLPFSLILLLGLLNRTQVKGSYRNTATINLMAVIVLLTVVSLSVYKLFSLLQ
ncbi:MAG: divalent metal cation transporter [Alteromonadaceae bacterium]|nr:divalent metal cation transporter [Alteromonadaceae bacterium]